MKTRIEELAADFRNLPACRVQDQEPHPDAPEIAAHFDRQGTPVATNKVCDGCFDLLVQVINAGKSHVAVLVSWDSRSWAWWGL